MTFAVALTQLADGVDALQLPECLCFAGQRFEIFCSERVEKYFNKIACKCPWLVSCCHKQSEPSLYIIHLLLHLIVHSAVLLFPPVRRSFLWSTSIPFLLELFYLLAYSSL